MLFRSIFPIADEAGGPWVDLARSAARTLSGTLVEADNAAPVQLLADLRDLFATTSADTWEDPGAPTSRSRICRWPARIESAFGTTPGSKAQATSADGPARIPSDAEHAGR